MEPLEKRLTSLEATVRRIGNSVSKLETQAESWQRLDDVEKRLRGVEISVAKLTVYATIGSVVGSAIVTVVIRFMFSA